MGGEREGERERTAEEEERKKLLASLTGNRNQPTGSVPDWDADRQNAPVEFRQRMNLHCSSKETYSRRKHFRLQRAWSPPALADRQSFGPLANDSVRNEGFVF